MTRKITQEEFSKRFYNIFPEAKMKIIEYTAISKPCVIQCLKCGKVHKYKKGNDVLNKHFCCETQQTKLESIKKRLNNNPQYSFVKQIDKDNIIIRHNICGQEMKRKISSVFKQPYWCSYCQDNEKKLIMSRQEAQQKLDNIQILTYNGYQKAGLYRCLKCGRIFKQRYDRLLQKNKGCPICNKNNK